MLPQKIHGPGEPRQHLAADVVHGPSELHALEGARAEIDLLTRQDAGSPEGAQVVRRARLTAHGNDLISPPREHIDSNAANAAARAGHDDRSAGRCLSVVLHPVDREPRGEARRPK